MLDDSLNLLEVYPDPPPPPNPEEMLPLLFAESILERMKAARAFCEIQDCRATPQLIVLLEDECPLVRVSAAYALGHNPSDRAVGPLISQLQEDWNGYVRKGIVWALGNCGDKTALSPLISTLKYDITAVRLWAASALGQLGCQEAVPELVRALQTETSAVVRSNCAWSLGKLVTSDTDEDIVEVLIEALQDEDLGVQSDAAIALRRINDSWGLQMLSSFEEERGYCDLIEHF